MNLDLCLKIFITSKNRRVHLITKEVPNEFALTKDKSLINQVKEKIQHYYLQKNSKVPKAILNTGMKMYIIKTVEVKRKEIKLV